MDSYTALIAPAELAPHLDDRRWIVFDSRHALQDRGYGARVYAEGHIPGARFADLDHDLAAPITAETGRHPLPDMTVFAAWLGNNGVNDESQVVVYDDGNGSFAARLWWMLRYLGHDTVAVLDGGMARWRSEGHPISAELPHIVPASFTPTPHPELIAELAEVEKISAGGSGLLVDARAGERYRGEIEPIDPKAGHIPGAISLPFSENIRTDGTFESPDALRTRFTERLGDTAPAESIHYCGSGVTACHNLLAMAAAGLPLGRLYVGAWSQWSKLPGHAIETGPERTEHSR